MNPYGAFLVYLIAILGFVALTLWMNRALGPKPAPTALKLEPFECGATPVEQVNVKAVPVKYYAIAILFILFDLEIAFLFPWAVVLGELGVWSVGFWSMMMFLGILTVGFIYEWKKGALDWE